jgi:hypothetical protein
MSIGFRRVGIAIAALNILFAAQSHGQENTSPSAWMTGDAIRQEFSGKGLAGHYPSGAPWTELIRTDGTTDYREGPKHWQGKWWATSQEFCFSYPAPGNGGCFRVVRVSTNCFELYDYTDNKNLETPPTEADRWNGRFWFADHPTTCEERPTV